MRVAPAPRGGPRRHLFVWDPASGAPGRRAGAPRRTVSRQMQFVALDSAGAAQTAGYAPYLDSRPLTAAEQPLAETLLASLDVRERIEQQALGYAIAQLVPQHLAEVKRGREELVL